MKKYLLLAVLVLTACSDGNTARKVLINNGYTDVEITGYKPFMCGKDDTFSTGFKATAPGGHKVSGAVCSAFTKGSTIRFD